MTTAGYGYDVVGNMTADGRTGYAYTFDAENHMTQASGTPSGTWTYTYDGNGLRVEKTNGTTGTLYWRDFAGNTIAETDLTGSTTDGAYREYVFFAGQRVAQRDATTPTPNVYFYYSDQVGSTTAISTAAGVSCYQATFTPYGQEMATQTTCSTNYKFTGYERDAETGFDYAFARYYNSTLGRFMSPDPLAGSIADPQTLNRYAYVGNSPTNFADPRGTHKCNAPQGQSMPAPCDGTGYGDGSDDAWGLDSGAEFDFYWGKLTSVSESGNFTSWDYMAFWGYGGYVGSLPLTPRNVKIVFYVKYGARLNACIQDVFGDDASSVPQQSLQNAPALNVSYTQAQLTALVGSDAVGWNNPSLGANGTVYEASDSIFNSTGSNALNSIFGTFAHELGNILDERMNPPGTTNGQAYGRTYGDPNDPIDSDTGAQVEECIFGSLQYP